MNSTNHQPLVLTTPSASGRRRSNLKCQRCRNQKKKCNVTVPNGNKCDACLKAGEPCGERMTAKQARLRPSQDLEPGLMTFILGSKVENMPPLLPDLMPMHHTRMTHDHGANNGIDPPAEIDLFERDTSNGAIEKNLRKLGLLILTKRFLEMQERSVLPLSERPAGRVELLFRLKDVMDEIKWTVVQLVQYTRTFSAAADHVPVDRIFGATLEALQKCPNMDTTVRVEALTEMALFYENHGNYIRLHEALIELLLLPSFDTAETSLDIHGILRGLMGRISQILTSSFSRSKISDEDTIIRLPILHQSLQSGSRDFFLSCLERTTNINNSQSPVLSGSDGTQSRGHTRTPLDENESINARDTLGRTALHQAAFNRDEQSCEDLIQNGADVEARDYGSHTILEIAALRGLNKTIELAVEKGADVNAKPIREASSPLQAAAENGFLETVRLLLKKGADKEMERPRDCLKAEEIARRNGHHSIAKELAEWIPSQSDQDFMGGLDHYWEDSHWRQHPPTAVFNNYLYEFGTGLDIPECRQWEA